MKLFRLMEITLCILFSLFLYAMACYYIGIKGLSILPYRNNGYGIMIYWIIYWLISISFVLSILCRIFLSVNNLLTSIFTSIGTVYLAAFFYLMILFPITDLIKFICEKIGLKGEFINFISRIYGNGILIFVIIFILIFIGVWKATHPVITDYNVNINKNAGKINLLNIVMVSDVHAGITVKEKGIANMVKSINGLRPDIVFFCGDMVDENTNSKMKKCLGEASKNIKSKYGIYAITGNHEYIGANLPETLSYLKRGNVKVLEDRVLKIDNSFYVVGRNDPVSFYKTKEKIKSLEELLKDIDKSLPIIVLNHQPIDLKAAKKEKVDLQLSGHTHKGQFLPNNFITGLVYEKDYGYLKKGNFNLIVSSGYGAWGPPIRIGTKGEIVNIRVNFNN